MQRVLLKLAVTSTEILMVADPLPRLPLLSHTSLHDPFAVYVPLIIHLAGWIHFLAAVLVSRSVGGCIFRLLLVPNAQRSMRSQHLEREKGTHNASTALLQ